MAGISAFVGHSFAQADAELVAKFTKYFDRLSNLLPNFSWVSAEAAEPKVLSEKVLTLIEGKNVFIGICTKKERVVTPSALSRVLLSPTYKKAKESDFEWKTTDWIIQEIGLARGLRLQLILLLEDGLRAPGGLQGDVEYIRFERDAPERCFGKFVEMITALSPRPSAGQATSPDARSSTAAENDQLSPTTNPDEMTPKPDWGREDYERSLVLLILKDDRAGLENMETTYFATDEGRQEENIASWESRKEYIRILFSKGGDLNKLRNFAKKHPCNVSVLADLARALSEYDSLEAAQQFEAAAEKALNADDKQRLLSSAAEHYARAEESDKARGIADALKSERPKDELRLLRFLQKLAELVKDEDASVGLLERIVQLTPDDFDARFSLAYHHAELDNKDMALLHYLKIPPQARSAVTWNNLGVAFDLSGLSGKSVEAYRRAEEMGETIAMSNLGYKLLGEGFVSEAQAECDRAFATKDYHKNVGTLAARLKEVPDEENAKQEELLENARPKNEFYRTFGRAISRPAPKNLAERWHGPVCTLDLKLSGKSVALSGTYEVDASPFAFALGNMFGALNKRTRYRVSYLGSLDGCAIKATVARSEDGENPIPKSLLEAAEIKTKVLMIVSDDLTTIQVLENPHGPNPTFYELGTPDHLET